MKINKSALAAVIVGGSLAFAPTVSAAEDMRQFRSSQRSIEDDSSLAPNVPGVTDKKGSDSKISQSDMLQLEQVLADAGYDPGTVDGMVDNQTRAAISEFQSDHQLTATGIIDAETGELLGIVISQSS